MQLGLTFWCVGLVLVSRIRRELCSFHTIRHALLPEEDAATVLRPIFASTDDASDVLSLLELSIAARPRTTKFPIVVPKDVAFAVERQRSGRQLFGFPKDSLARFSDAAMDFAVMLVQGAIVLEAAATKLTDPRRSYERGRKRSTAILDEIDRLSVEHFRRRYIQRFLCALSQHIGQRLALPQIPRVLFLFYGFHSAIPVSQPPGGEATC